MTDKPKDARKMSAAEYEAAKAQILKPAPTKTHEPRTVSAVGHLGEAEYQRRLQVIRRG